MKIHCKQCQQAVTDSLYLKRKHDRKRTSWNSTDEVEYYETKLTVPKGAVVKLRKSPYYEQDYPIVCVDRESLLIPYPVYQPGMGCCDIDWADIRCTCGALLGVMRYDCWQTGNYVSLNGNAVELRNNTFNVRRDAFNYMLMLKGGSWYIRRRATLAKLHKSNLRTANKPLAYEWTEEYNDPIPEQQWSPSKSDLDSLADHASEAYNHRTGL